MTLHAGRIVPCNNAGILLSTRHFLLWNDGGRTAPPFFCLLNMTKLPGNAGILDVLLFLSETGITRVHAGMRESLLQRFAVATLHFRLCAYLVSICSPLAAFALRGNIALNISALCSAAFWRWYAWSGKRGADERKRGRAAWEERRATTRGGSFMTSSLRSGRRVVWLNIADIHLPVKRDRDNSASWKATGGRGACARRFAWRET